MHSGYFDETCPVRTKPARIRDPALPICPVPGKGGSEASLSICAPGVPPACYHCVNG